MKTAMEKKQCGQKNAAAAVIVTIDISPYSGLFQFFSI